MSQLEKKSSDKNETSIDIRLLVLIKRNWRPYIEQYVVFPDVEATLYEPGNDLAFGSYDRALR